MQDRLLSIGQRPINNMVDVTNFILMETGQPLHAFDFDFLAENRIVVRTASKGERFVTLDEKERILDPEMLMICDGKKAVAVGGVMGGFNSEIKDGTTRVLLESAYFNSVSVRRTSKRLGLSTEASHRFERGVDPAGQVAAANRVAKLMIKLGGGRLISGLIDEHPKPSSIKSLKLSVKNTNRLLGTYPGVVGLKTGDTPFADKVLLGVTERGQRRIVTVVMGSDDHFSDSRELIDWAYSTYGLRDRWLRPFFSEQGGGAIVADDLELTESEERRLGAMPRIDDGRWRMSALTDLPKAALITEWLKAALPSVVGGDG